MGKTRLLHLSAIETKGTLQVAISVGVGPDGEDGCTRRRVMTWDSTEEPCCIEDWVNEVVNVLTDPEEDTPWAYTHGAACEEHGDAHGAE